MHGDFLHDMGVQEKVQYVGSPYVHSSMHIVKEALAPAFNPTSNLHRYAPLYYYFLNCNLPSMVHSGQQHELCRIRSIRVLGNTLYSSYSRGMYVLRTPYDVHIRPVNLRLYLQLVADDGK